ncbi:MAG: Ezrin/radixin/moesin family protein [Cyclobacteriaceae bacterium]
MKRVISLFALVLCFTFVYDASAQMSKKEAKEWKKRIKKLQPEQYKQLLDENKSLKGQVTSLRTELGNVDDRIAEKDEQILSFQSQVSDLRNELTRVQSQAQAQAQPVASSGSGDQDKGLAFKVQIGSFRQKDLSKYLDNSKNFSGEEEDGMRKYTIGFFRDYNEADTFKKYLREMGVKDAWIVPYNDGARVSIKDALEGKFN